MVTDVERPSFPQSASRGVLHIVSDNPVNFLQAAWIPRPRPMLTGTHWSLLCSFLFGSPTPRKTLDYFWLQVYISFGSERVDVFSFLSLIETVVICVFLGPDLPLWSVPFSVQKV